MKLYSGHAGGGNAGTVISNNTTTNSYIITEYLYFQITTHKMRRFLIYLFLQIIYIFQAVPPPIIRSTKLYIQLQALSTNTAACCCRG